MKSIAEIVSWRFLCLVPLLLLAGCGGKGGPSGCPDDLTIPDKMQVLGSNFDQGLFVLRLRTTDYEMDEVVDLFRKNMKKDEWTVKSDSATEKNGGELEFSKNETRKCVIFISKTSGSKSDANSINIDIKCDRQNTGR